jgi:AsmA family
VVTMDLRSNRVDLTDLNGFIGGTPARSNTANATPEEREAAAKANASPKLLPDTPISVPRLDWADIHLHYHGAHILGRNIPLDDLTVALDAVSGRITVHPISFGVGKGQLTGNVDLTPDSGKNVHAKIDLRMRNLDVSRMMAATHTFEGAGSVSGVGTIDATGDSLASLMANGNGEVKMAMAGGDLSAVLVDLTGLHFGNALLPALGVPNKTQVQCFVGDLGMQRGILHFKAMNARYRGGHHQCRWQRRFVERNHRPVVENGREAFLRGIAADAHQHQWHVQGPKNPAGRRSRGPSGRGGRAGRPVRAVGDPADDPIWHFGGGRRALRRVAAASSGECRWNSAPAPGTGRVSRALSCILSADVAS